MKTDNLIAQKLAEIKKMGTTIYPGQLPQGIHGVLHDPKKLEEKLKSFAIDLLKSVGEEAEKIEKPSLWVKSYKTRDDYIKAVGYNAALSDLRVRLKEMEEVI